MSISSPNSTSRELPDLAERVSGLQLNGTNPKHKLPPQEEGVIQPDGRTVVDEELEKFRREWQKEVQAKKGKEREVDVGPVRWKEKEHDTASRAEGDVPTATVAGQPRAASRSPVSPSRALRADSSTSPRSPMKTFSSIEERPSVGSAASTSPKASSSSWSTNPRELAFPTLRKGGKMSRENKREEAVRIYAEAVENEQSGQLNEALMLYRQAFKLDDNVDRLYALHRSRQVQAAPVVHSSTDLVSPSPPTDEPYSFQRHIQTAPDYLSSAPHQLPVDSSDPTNRSSHSRTSVLTNILNNASISPGEAKFEPAEETLPIPIASIPAELFGSILLHLDVASLERLGSTCWRARYLTAHSAKWKSLVEGIYVPPAIVPRDDVKLGRKEIVRRHNGEWRTCLIEEDRIRMDGCYIAVCHYIRPGAGDEWVTITHMITYHRFLRFYPDGTVISFLTTDHPSEVVPRLKPSLRSKGLHIGKYRLFRPDHDHDHNDNYPRTKDYHQGHKTSVIITDLLEPGATEPKYEFEMELALRETGRGRWNKLDIIDYRSINLATGESLGLALKHQKPFYFSKVRSYHPSL